MFTEAKTLKFHRTALIAMTTVLSMSAIGCSLFFEYPLSECPQVLSEERVSRALRNRGLNFGFSSAAFFGEKFYVGTGSGLFEFDSMRPLRGFKCFAATWDSFEEVTSDRANNLLWTYNSRTATLLRFDGTSWFSVPLPPPDERYYSREDIYTFRMFSTESHFWLQIAKSAWRWDNRNASWIAEPLPQTDCQVFNKTNDKAIGCFASIAPLRNTTLLIVHSDLSGEGWDKKAHHDLPTPHVDRIMFRYGDKWIEVTAEPPQGFYTKDVAVGSQYAYVRTYDDLLFRISESTVEQLPSLGKIDVMTATSDGNLLVGFQGHGIFEYKDNWTKRFDYPFASLEDYYVVIAEADGRLALAWNSPLIDGKKTAPARLWITHQGKLNEITF